MNEIEKASTINKAKITPLEKVYRLIRSFFLREREVLVPNFHTSFLPHSGPPSASQLGTNFQSEFFLLLQRQPGLRLNSLTTSISGGPDPGGWMPPYFIYSACVFPGHFVDLKQDSPRMELLSTGEEPVGLECMQNKICFETSDITNSDDQLTLPDQTILIWREWRKVTVMNI